MTGNSSVKTVMGFLCDSGKIKRNFNEKSQIFDILMTLAHHIIGEKMHKNYLE